MDGIQKDHGVDRLKRPLLPLLGNGQNSVCDAADRAVRNGYSLDILDMGLNIAGGHALGIHLQDFLLNVLTDAGLVLFQYLRFKFPLSVSRYRHIHFTKTGMQTLAAVAVAAVVCVLVLVIVFAVAQFVIQLSFQTILHELGNGLFEQVLDVVHTADVCHLQQLTDLLSPGIFFRASILSCNIKTSDVVLLFYTTQEVYTKLRIVSWLPQISSCASTTLL